MSFPKSSACTNLAKGRPPATRAITSALTATSSLAVGRATTSAGRTNTMALGADRGRVLRTFVRESAVLVTVGAGRAYYSSRHAESLLFGLRTTDPLTIALSVGGLFVHWRRASIPAWRPAARQPASPFRRGAADCASGRLTLVTYTPSGDSLAKRTRPARSCES